MCTFKKIRFKLILFLFFIFILAGSAAYADEGPNLGSRVLTIGMTGADVLELQTILNRHSYPVGPEDGIFGNKTRNGVIGFQQNNGLTADGIAGANTLRAIKGLIDKLESYTVKSGDTLYFIGLQYGVTAELLKTSNGLTSDLIYPGQVLTIPKNGSPPDSQAPSPPEPSRKPLNEILRERGINTPIPNMKIVVDKSDHLLTIYSGVFPLKSYHSAFGDNGLAPKEKAGDHRTPEGSYYIAERHVIAPSDQYLGSRWMRVSYPNIQDAKRGLSQGLIDMATYHTIVEAINKGEIPPQRTALGGGIGIHGGSDNGINTGDYWTWGCIGLTDYAVDEIYDYIGIGTQLVIQY